MNITVELLLPLLVLLFQRLSHLFCFLLDPLQLLLLVVLDLSDLTPQLVDLLLLLFSMPGSLGSKPLKLLFTVLSGLLK